MNHFKTCMKFRQLLKDAGQKREALPLFGAVDGMTARTLADEGFSALYISGGALSASYGVPDVGLLTLDHFTAKIKEISMASGGLPILADADTGFGGTENMRKTVTDYFSAGCSGLHVEDQVFPKRCGHLDGKELVSIEEMTSKIRAAVETSQEVSDGAFVICARTDARHTSGLTETIDRSLAYLDAGADLIFPEGLETREEFEIVEKTIRSQPGHEEAFLLANMTEFGKTEYMKLNTFSQMGYNTVIYPVSTLRIQAKAVEDFVRQFRNEDDGTVEPQLAKMRTREELYNALRYEPGKPFIYPTV